MVKKLKSKTNKVKVKQIKSNKKCNKNNIKKLSNYEINNINHVINKKSKKIQRRENKNENYNDAKNKEQLKSTNKEIQNKKLFSNIENKIINDKSISDINQEKNIDITINSFDVINNSKNDVLKNIKSKQNKTVDNKNLGNEFNFNDSSDKNYNIYDNKKYFLRENTDKNKKIRKLIKDLSESGSELESDSESINSDESISFSLNDHKINNDYKEDKFLDTFISSSGNSRYLDPFYSFLGETYVRKFLAYHENDIIKYENYDSFRARVLEESKYNWKIEYLLEKIFKTLYKAIKNDWNNRYIPSYYENFIIKWSIFFHEEFNRKGTKCYKSKYLRIKRYKMNKKYGIKNDEIYNFVMKRLITFCPGDKKWYDYWYYFQLIPKYIIFSYYIVLKQSSYFFLYVLSDLKNFLETVIRLGGLKGYCKSIKKIFVDESKQYSTSPYRSKKQLIKEIFD